MPRDEAKLVNDILRTFGAHPDVRLFRINTLAARDANGRLVRSAQPGFPDILAFCRGGLTIAIECKSARGVMSTSQVAFQRMCVELGVPHVVARSLDDVACILAEVVRHR
jgi:hypothetical protein